MKNYKVVVKTNYMNLGFFKQGITREDAVLRAIEDAWIQCGVDLDDIVDIEVTPN